jgi:hypothetical protein
MTESKSFEVQPGTQFNFQNDTTAPIRIKVVTECGTETVSTLHPGARLEMTAGRRSANVEILGADEGGYTGLKLVR